MTCRAGGKPLTTTTYDTADAPTIEDLKGWMGEGE